MTDAPERIWAAPNDEDLWHAPYLGKARCAGAVEYIRADLHQSALDRAVKAEAECERLRETLRQVDAIVDEMIVEAKRIRDGHRPARFAK